MSCVRTHDPDREFEEAYGAFLHGDLVRAQKAAEAGYRSYSSSNLEEAWKFRVLDARVLSWRGMNEQLLSLLHGELPASLKQTNLDFQKTELEGLAYARLHRYGESESKLSEAARDCAKSNCSVLGEIFAAQGFLAIERGHYADGEDCFEKGLEFARRQKDPFLEARAFLQLSHAALEQDHFDEAIDWSNRADEAARAIGAQAIEADAKGNLGWARYKTGDSEGALPLLLATERSFEQLGSQVEQVRWLTTTGYVYLDRNERSVADDLYQRALHLARQINSKEEISDALTSLAFVAVQTGQLDQARQYSDEAIAMARADGNRVDELYPMLAKGQIAARSGDLSTAELTFRKVSDDPKVDLSLKWEAQHELANLYLSEKALANADGAYRAALSTFETARAQIQHEGVRLPFLGNANSLYDDYVQFLVGQHRTDQALQVADYSRAQTLAEGLGLLKGNGTFAAPKFDPRSAARAEEGTILFYWLGAQRSYLWAITPREVRMFPLPPASEIDAEVRTFRKVLLGPRDLLESGDPAGTTLYQTLLEPAQQLLVPGSRVVVVPDGSLNTINFETLIIPSPKPHYWIEDATVLYATSLRMLLAAKHDNRTALPEKLLLIGDALVPGNEFADLPNAKVELTEIGHHFPSAQEVIYTQNEANPETYVASHPERFSYIHFVAHGTASRTSPLDSAVILSRATAQDDSFKLYAREIIQHPLRARLVTISACNGAGTRTYAGEGLVGLSWAFLRAGAHNVIGALWEVSDASTPQLMNQLYDGLSHGQRPAQALRAAKLSLLHSDSVFRKPFYWAPFQLYTGS